MSAVVKLAGFAIVLVAVFALGAGLGAAFGPSPDDDAADSARQGHGHSSGFALVPAASTLGSGTQMFRFQVIDPGGDVVTGFEVEHEKELHLIVASTDLVMFEHVHPVRAPDGWWSVELHDLRPGSYRTYADFTVQDGPSLVLEHDLTVPGAAESRTMPAPSTAVDVDGLKVELDAGTLAVGESSAMLRVSRAGRAVALERYLGAGGHLVAIGAADLSYLHVHPTGGDNAGGEIQFALAIPDPGRHRLFFDFQVDGVVRTAAFTVDVTDRSTGAEPRSDQPQHGH